MEQIERSTDWQEEDDVEWREVKAEVFATVMDFFATGLPVVSEDKPPTDTGELWGRSFVAKRTFAFGSSPKQGKWMDIFVSDGK